MLAKFEHYKNHPLYSKEMLEDYEILHDRKLLQRLGQESRKMMDAEEYSRKNSPF